MTATTTALESYFASSPKNRPAALGNPKKGDYGCAIFEEDELPYRCRLLTDAYVRSDRSSRGLLVDILFIDFGNVSLGVSAADVFQLPPSDGRLGRILDPAKNPGFAVGPFRPVSDQGNAAIDDKISALLEQDVIN